MKEQLIRDVEALFGDTANAEEIKQEILQNTLDRYDDLIDQGKSPEAAYSLSLSGIGDLSEIFRPSEVSTEGSVADATSRSKLRKNISSIIFITGLCAYFALSLASRAWHITWVTFLIMASAQGLAKAIVDLKEGC